MFESFNQHIMEILISFCLFLIIEFFYPIKTTNDEANNSIEKSRKHFLSISIFIISFLITLSITNFNEIKQEISRIVIIFNNIGEKQTRNNLKEISQNYEALSEEDNYIKILTKEKIGTLNNELKKKTFNIQTIHPSNELAKIYKYVNNTVIASDLGKLDVFFENKDGASKGIYQQAQKRAIEKGIPVIRFFLYSEENKILEEKFRERVSKIHNLNMTLCTTIVNISNTEITPKDIIMFDNLTLAETEYTQQGKPERVIISKDIEKGINFFKKLFDHNSQCTYTMNKEQVTKLFRNSIPKEIFNNENLAQKFYEHKLREIEILNK